MTPESLAQAWRERAEARRRRVDERHQQALDRARKAAEALKDDFGATEVWLFGSHAWGRPHARSDIDLAAAGVAPDRFFAALSTVARLIGEPVDLVPLEDCTPSLRERIRREGVAL